MLHVSSITVNFFMNSTECLVIGRQPFGRGHTKIPYAMIKEYVDVTPPQRTYNRPPRYSTQARVTVEEPIRRTKVSLMVKVLDAFKRGVRCTI